MTVQGPTHPTALQFVHFPLDLTQFAEEAWEKVGKTGELLHQVFPGTQKLQRGGGDVESCPSSSTLLSH